MATAATPTRGRPRKDDADRRTEVLYLKLTPAERSLIDEVCEKPTVWARDVLIKAANAEKLALQRKRKRR
jgi:hypothetical protein